MARAAMPTVNGDDGRRMTGTIRPSEVVVCRGHGVLCVTVTADECVGSGAVDPRDYACRVKPHRLRAALLVAVAVASVAVVSVLGSVGVFARLDDASFDTRLALRGERIPSADVVVVGIDDATLSDLRIQWPYPRTLHARAIDALTDAGAKVIAYDITFAEPTTPFDDSAAARRAAEDGDLALLDAITRAKRVVLAANEFDTSRPGRPVPNILFTDEDLAAAGATYGNTAWAVDGAFRRLPLTLRGVPSFPVVTAERALGDRITAAGFRDGRIPVNYVQRRLPVIPFASVLDGTFSPADVRGKTVIVGATASRLGDLHTTPWGTTRPGAEITAQAVATLLDGSPLRDTPSWVAALLPLVLVGLAAFASWRLNPVVGAVVGVALVAATAVGIHLAFIGGHVIAPSAPLLAGVLCVIGAFAVNSATVMRDHRRLRASFRRFLPPTIVDEVVAQAQDGELGLVGERRYATVLFADLRGFTAAAETLPPETVIDVLNRYLSAVADAILDVGGTVVSYQGDGVMAVFGAPVEQIDHADRALAAAREIRDVRVPTFNQWFTSVTGKAEFHVGIGVASGPVMSGTVGSHRRMEYTAVGDTTNAAARLQLLAKDSPHTVLVSDATRAALTVPASDLVAVGSRDLRGKRVAASVWALAARHPTGPPE